MDIKNITLKTVLKAILIIVIFIIYSCGNDDNGGIEMQMEQNNEAPVVTSQTFIVAESIADNLPIGTVEASDPEGDDLSFSISINDGDLFKINNEGVLSLNDLQTLDFETTDNHTITVAISDGTITSEVTVTIIVTDIDDTSFVTTWETTTAGEMVTIPTRAVEYVYDYTINWGDGDIQTNVTDNATHIYTNPGTYTVSINGKFPAILIPNNDKSQEQLQSVKQWGIIQWQTMEGAFQRASNLAINALDNPDLSQVVSLERMFSNANVTGDFSNWNVSNVTKMTMTFGFSKFNGDISTWNVSNVTTMYAMFSRSNFNNDISKWNVKSVEDMGSMFSNSIFNQDISDWNVSNVIAMDGMFSNSVFNQDISAWNVEKVNNMGGMFKNSPFNQNLSEWDVEKVTTCGDFAIDAPLTTAKTPKFTNCTP